MFIQHLNLEQQSALYHFSKRLIATDGHIDERETLLLETIAAQCCSNVDLDKTFDLAELSPLFSENSEKMSFLIELIGVGYADQTLEESENNFIKHIAETIGVELSRLEELKDWVQRQIALVTEAQKFLEK
ncbi:TerB family tellurite resistance protein [Vibrio vulnificus]|uniref:TerB family tellurite resistance protein n=1 Tax=Vibrio vulnificus TaxID=672 RepID=UPI001A325F74|nr:TerB family tellurite resistance protein [Vibrio vulnificus]EHD0101816.1 DNA repair protein [Vibrio vulnificus]MCA4014320.1 TerB family tellurite resistance protein [Vibrio vulnificus]HAS8388987.1 DNA repair protein [Vibrio vulnificus]HDY7931563.1 TerB family tellurite resistance protein [Vibrio vulnificus]